MKRGCVEPHVFYTLLEQLRSVDWDCEKLRAMIPNMTEGELQTLGDYLCTHPNLSFVNFTFQQDFICATDDSEYSVAFQALVASAFVLLILAAVVGNLCVMWIIYSHKVMHHGFNYFLFNMALADFLIAVLNVGSSWTFNLYYDWWYGSAFCAINQFFGVAPTCVSVLSMMALSWDRCQAVVNPLRKRPLSTRRTAATISTIWAISSLFAMPTALFAAVSFTPIYVIATRKMTVRRVCSPNYPGWFQFQHEDPGALYEHSLFIVLYAMPLFLLSFTFARIAYAFRRADNTVAARNTKRGDQVKAKSKAVKMLALMVAIFMICWAPYHFYHTFLPMVSSLEIKALLYSTYVGVYWLAMSSCAYNPIIYCYANARFRIGFRYAFRWLPCVNFRSEEYELSQLFPERVRSVAVSKMDRSRSTRYSEMSVLNTALLHRTSCPVPFDVGTERRRRAGAFSSIPQSMIDNAAAEVGAHAATPKPTPEHANQPRKQSTVLPAITINQNGSDCTNLPRNGKRISFSQADSTEKQIKQKAAAANGPGPVSILKSSSTTRSTATSSPQRRRTSSTSRWTPSAKRKEKQSDEKAYLLDDDLEDNTVYSGNRSPNTQSKSTTANIFVPDFFDSLHMTYV